MAKIIFRGGVEKRRVELSKAMNYENNQALQAWFYFFMFGEEVGGLV
jgi:hypothetical protein